MLVKLERLGYRVVKKLWRYVKPFLSDTAMSRTDRRTETDLLYQYRASVCWRAIKTYANANAKYFAFSEMIKKIEPQLQWNANKRTAAFEWYHFEWSWAKYSMTRSIARSICDSWASCCSCFIVCSVERMTSFVRKLRPPIFFLGGGCV